MTDGDADEVEQEDEFDFGHLLGATRFSGVEDAAVRAERDDTGDATPDARRPLISEVPLDPDALPPRPTPSLGLVEPAGGDTQVFDVPSEPEPSPSLPTAATSSIAVHVTSLEDEPAQQVTDAQPDEVKDEEDEDEDDGPTISLSVLRAIQATPTPSGPTVQAVHCPSDHPNPPHGEICRQCAQRIVDRSVSTIARPSLGSLQFDNGTRVVLDHPAVIGRKPRTDIVIEDETASPVRIDDPDKVLSRTHLEVRLVDWQVQIVDRDSMNHTHVEVPGHAPTQVRPGEPFPIPLGTSVSMGGSVRFTYEIAR
jgi:hypothetical protein